MPNTGKKVKKIYKNAEARIKNGEAANIIELIRALSARYIKKLKKPLDIPGPFNDQGDWIAPFQIGKFPNKKLQLKVSSSLSNYPSIGAGWQLYPAWTKNLDNIDNFKDRDSDGLVFKNTKEREKYVKKVNEDKVKVKTLEDVDKLTEAMIDREDRVEDQKLSKKDKKKYTKELKKLEKVGEKVVEKGTAKKELAKYLMNCLAWCPSKALMKKRPKNVEEIPAFLGRLMLSMRQELELPVLITEQARAADMFFGVAVCEEFRISGASRYMRSCLDIMVKKNRTFQEVFGYDKKTTICTLSPKGGTEMTRTCLVKGKMSGLSDDQKAGYKYLAEASDNGKIRDISWVKKLKAKKDLKQSKGKFT